MKKSAKYEIIYQDLKKQILNGAFPDGKLPPVSELTEIYNASLLTVNNAVKLLAENGFVIRSSGRGGTRINQPGLRTINMQNSNTWGHHPDILSHRKVTLRYLTAHSGAYIPKSMPLVIKEFEKRYPWIHIEQDFTNSVDFLKNSDHDILQASHSTILPLICRGRLLDLQPYFANFGRNSKCLHDNCTVPLMISVPLFFCTDDEIGELPSDWQQFIKLNTDLKKMGKHSALLSGFFSLLQFFIGDIRKNISDKNREKDIIMLIEILRDYYKWDTPWNNFSPNDIFEAIRKNKLSFFAGYCSSSIMPLAESCRIAPLPDAGLYPADTVRAGINKDCLHKTEAWLFINFLRSEAVQKKLADESYGIPYHEKVFNTDFKKKFPSLHKIVAPLLNKIHEAGISEDARSMIYHTVYPILEECFANDIPGRECMELIRDNIREFIILDNIENNIRGEL